MSTALVARWTRPNAWSPDRAAERIDSFTDTCAVCGVSGPFTRGAGALREGYPCASCGSSVRYQAQAQALVRRYSRNAATCFAELCDEPEFQQLRIWEPGELGPFRSYLGKIPRYEVSSYWPEVRPGDQRDGVRCEDLMALSYEASSFDLVITSDVFEHVRRPYVGFAEVHRVLRPHGAHVFSIPFRWPRRAQTQPRVDTSGDEDLLLMAPKHHRHHLVYNDFGLDLIDRLHEIGFHTEVIPFESPGEEPRRIVTFSSTKLGSQHGP